jgi:hypothetical protein
MSLIIVFISFIFFTSCCNLVAQINVKTTDAEGVFIVEGHIFHVISLNKNCIEKYTE